MVLFILSMRKDVFVGVLVIALISFSKDMFSALSVCLSLPNLWTYWQISNKFHEVGILAMLSSYKFNENLHLD